NDLAAAHLAAVTYLHEHAGAHRFNLGNGTGFTVLEVIEAARKISQRDIAFERAPRRAGDPPVLVASSDRARRMLGWQPAFTRMDDIIASAWRWHAETGSYQA